MKEIQKEKIREEFKKKFPIGDDFDYYKVIDFWLNLLDRELGRSHEKGRQSVLDEIEEEQKKLLQGFAYKPNQN